MPILTYTEYNLIYTVPYMKSYNQPYIVRNIFYQNIMGNLFFSFSDIIWSVHVNWYF